MTRCPKCGHDNPKDTLYCEECDWRLDQSVSKMKKEKTSADVMMYSGIAMVLGIISIATSTSIAIGVRMDTAQYPLIFFTIYRNLISSNR